MDLTIGLSNAFSQKFSFRWPPQHSLRREAAALSLTGFLGVSLVMHSHPGVCSLHLKCPMSTDNTAVVRLRHCWLSSHRKFLVMRQIAKGSTKSDCCHPHWYLPVQHRRHRYGSFISFLSTCSSHHSAQVSRSSTLRPWPLNHLERGIY
jgi:hypothetical protein